MVTNIKLNKGFRENSTGSGSTSPNIRLKSNKDYSSSQSPSPAPKKGTHQMLNARSRRVPRRTINTRNRSTKSFEKPSHAKPHEGFVIHKKNKIAGQAQPKGLLTSKSRTNRNKIRNAALLNQTQSGEIVVESP